MMRKARTLLRSCAVGAVALVAGCAPGFGPGIQIGASPGAGLHVGPSSCALTGMQSPLSMSSSTAHLTSRIRQIDMIKARVVQMSQVPTRQERMEGWKRLGSGAC